MVNNLSGQRKTSLSIFLYLPLPSGMGVHKNYDLLMKKLSEVKQSKFMHQHATTGNKFVSSHYHLERLKKIAPHRVVSDIGIRLLLNKLGKGTIEIPQKIVDYETVDFLYEFDSFLFCISSCIDSFLWEVNLAYGLNIKRVDLRKIKTKMKKDFKYDPLTIHLDKSFSEEWFLYIRKMRNFIAHKMMSAVVTSHDSKFYLPDKPSTETISINKGLEVFQFFEHVLRRLNDFLEKGYASLQKKVADEKLVAEKA